ncbi:hypothetical protein Pcac1_g2003 [Phytophthora cactorum]|nr:hypothetical protein Pcac1_g2003 [Phytophthora cactorum]
MTTRVNAKLHNEDLKDAYRVWLKDLYDDKPERLLKRLDKKKKSGGGRRARRNQRMQHAQQHTAASALKDVALKKAEQAKLPSISLVHTPADKQALQESQSRRHQALVDEANYSAFQYSHQPTWRPGLAFFQQLVRQLLEKPSPECGNNYSEGVITAEMTGFPVLVAPILLRVPVCRQEPENQQVNDLDGPDDDKEPCGYLTKKMLRSCEFYDDFIQQQDMSLAGGFAEFHSALTFHLQHRLPKRDRSQLYEPQPLCRACVKRYHSLRQQWIETVGVLKTMATIGGPRRKITQAKEHSEQTLLPSRKLPSLQRKPEALSALTCSYSSPALTASNPSNTTKLNKREDTTKQSNYLTELAAMEEMLAELEPPSLLKDKKHEHQNVAPVSSSAPLNALSTKPPRHEDIFPKWDGVTRIEEMWQNLTFKPLEKQLTKVGSNHSESGGVKQGYNSISLQQELAKVAKTGDNNENDKLTEPELKLYKEVDQSPGISLMKSVAACTVHVQHCRRVFEDESYREGLVNDAVSALRSGKPNVCLVVTPPPQNPHNKKHANEDGDELAEMALRSLYIDVKQVIAASSDGLATELLLSSWPMRPTVWRETSGCITVNLGPA